MNVKEKLSGLQSSLQGMLPKGKPASKKAAATGKAGTSSGKAGTAAGKRKKKKGIQALLHSRFYQIYFALVALALIAILVGTSVLRGNLADYESAQPSYVAEDVVEMFESGDFERIYTLDTAADEVAEGDKDFYITSMHEVADGKDVEWNETFDSTDDVHNYNVTLDGANFASFSLIPSGETTPKGNRLWKLGSVTTNVVMKDASTPEPTPVPTPTPYVPTYTCRITAPNTYTVTVDGVKLDPQNSYAQENDLFPSGFLPSAIPSPVMTTYTYESPKEQPDVHVTDESGEEMTVTKGEDNTWSCGLKEDETVKARMKGGVLSLGKKIARFTTRDGSKDAILQYCARKSPAWSAFENLSNRYATPHSDIRFANEKVDQFYVLSDKCMTCHVSFDYYLKTSQGIRKYPTSYTFCVVAVDGGKVYNLLMQ